MRRGTLRVVFPTLPLKRENNAGCREIDNDEWAQRDSNPRHLPCKGSALPTELCALKPVRSLPCTSMRGAPMSGRRQQIADHHVGGEFGVAIERPTLTQDQQLEQFG
jgi:hypothetical protein